MPVASDFACRIPYTYQQRIASGNSKYSRYSYQVHQSIVKEDQIEMHAAYVFIKLFYILLNFRNNDIVTASDVKDT